MRQWEIYRCPNLAEGPHPVVIVSNDERCENDHYELVNVLLCRSIRPDKPARNTDVTLDEADGLDWPTACGCEFVYNVAKDEIKVGALLGTVTRPRQIQVARRLFDSLRLRQF